MIINEEKEIIKELKDFLLSFEIKLICSICKDSGFYIYKGEKCPNYLSCLRDDKKHKFECDNHSGFEMKKKINWFKFRIANLNSGVWKYYQTAEYKDGEFIEFKFIKRISGVEYKY